MVEEEGRDITLSVLQSHKTSISDTHVPCIQSIQRLNSPEDTLLTGHFSLSAPLVRRPLALCCVLNQSTLKFKKEDPAHASSSAFPLPFAPEYQTGDLEISEKCYSLLVVS